MLNVCPTAFLSVAVYTILINQNEADQAKLSSTQKSWMFLLNSAWIRCINFCMYTQKVMFMSKISAAVLLPKSIFVISCQKLLTVDKK